MNRQDNKNIEDFVRKDLDEKFEQQLRCIKGRHTRDIEEYNERYEYTKLMLDELKTNDLTFMLS